MCVILPWQRDLHKHSKAIRGGAYPENVWPQKRQTAAAALTRSAHLGQVFSASATLRTNVTVSVPSGFTISMYTNTRKPMNTKHRSSATMNDAHQ